MMNHGVRFSASAANAITLESPLPNFTNVLIGYLTTIVVLQISNVHTIELFMEIMAWIDDSKFVGFVVGGTTALRCPSTMRLAKVIN